MNNIFGPGGDATGARATLLACVLAALAFDAAAAQLVVDASKANADDGGAANAAQPLRTIGAAMKRLQPGDRVFIAAGTYREPIVLPTRRWTAAADTVIEGDPRGGTLIKGSTLRTDWGGTGNGHFVARIDYEPEQIFVDGQPLQQIGGTVYGGYPELASHPLTPLFAGAGGGVWPGRVAGDRSSLPVNSFHYDARLGNVMIRVPDNLQGRVVEVASLIHVLSASGVERLVLKNLTFEHSNTTSGGRGGAVQIDGNNVRIENVTIRRADGACLGLNGANNQVISSQFTDCGQLGMGGRGTGWRIDDVTVARNNYRGFNKWWEAGGAKFVGDGGLKEATISRFKAIANSGDGLWFDYRNRDNRITDSVLAFNAGFGLHVEVSEGFVVDNNIMIGNKQRGLYFRQTSGSTIAFNLMALNGLDGVAVLDAGSPNEVAPAVRNNWIVANVIAWNQFGLTLPHGLGDNRSLGNMLMGDQPALGVRSGWTRAMTRDEWIARSMDPYGNWTELPAADRPALDPSLPVEKQLDWYWKLRAGLPGLPQSVATALRVRTRALADTPETKAGAGSTPWSAR